MKNSTNLALPAVKSTKRSLLKIVALSLSILALGSSAANAAVERCPRADTFHWEESTHFWQITESGWRITSSGAYPREEAPYTAVGAFLIENKRVDCRYRGSEGQLTIHIIKDQDSVNAEPDTFSIFPSLDTKQKWMDGSLGPVDDWICPGEDAEGNKRINCTFEVNYTPKDPAAILRSPFNLN